VSEILQVSRTRISQWHCKNHTHHRKERSRALVSFPPADIYRTAQSLTRSFFPFSIIAEVLTVLDETETALAADPSARRAVPRKRLLSRLSGRPCLTLCYGLGCISGNGSLSKSDSAHRIMVFIFRLKGGKCFDFRLYMRRLMVHA
jgi:hypothetical protein